MPNTLKSARRTRSKAELKVPKSLKEVAMHYVIRQDKSPYASQLKERENHFADMKATGERVLQTKIKEYRKVGRVLLVLGETFFRVMVTCTGETHYVPPESLKITSNPLRFSSWVQFQKFIVYHFLLVRRKKIKNKNTAYLFSSIKIFRQLFILNPLCYLKR